MPSLARSVYVPDLLKAFVERAPLLANTHGLTRRQRESMKQAWRGLVRVRIQSLRIPDHATYADVVTVLDAVLDEVTTCRKILRNMGRVVRRTRNPEGDAWLRRQLEGLGK